MLPMNPDVIVEYNPAEIYLMGLLKKHLDDGLFWFSYTWDLTRRLQAQWSDSGDGKALWEVADDRFFWNKFLQSRFIDAAIADPEGKIGPFILPVLYGTFDIRSTVINSHAMRFCLISRRSRHRAGTRYFRRGVDHEGHVANFNETEQVMLVGRAGKSTGDLCGARLSFVQIRGSIPLYWAEVNNLRYKPELQVMELPDSENAMRAHLQELVKIYGDQDMVNLVNHKGHELPMKEAYEKYIAQVNLPRVRYEYFDFHTECKNMRWDRINLLLESIEEDMLRNGYFYEDADRPEIVKQQLGVVRTNCMDNLDRTNVAQSAVAKWMLNRQLRDIGVFQEHESVDTYDDFMFHFRNMWADHGDYISKAYSGTGALKTDFTRTGKRLYMGALADGVNSIMRYLKNNYFDGPRQDGFDLFTGSWTPRPGAVAASGLWLDTRPLLIRSMPPLASLALFMICAGLTLPRTSAALALIAAHGISYVSWPRLNPLTDIIEYSGPGFKGPRKGRGLGFLAGAVHKAKSVTGAGMNASAKQKWVAAQEVEMGTAKSTSTSSPPSGPKIVPVHDAENKDEESAADYNTGGYLAVKLKDTFRNGRYVVQRKLGWGHFSTVWLIKDNDLNKHSALKVVKSAGRYAETARDEIRLLRAVMAANPQHPGRDFIVSFFDSFTHTGPEDSHICIVFEPLGENLLALIERNKSKGVPRSLVKTISKQILLGLQYLHDECDLVHTDIKPENIMISILDVESLILSELSTSSSPTSRRVGVPPGKSRAGGVVIPRKYRDRHVQIFDSQPLQSPSPTSISPGSRRGLHMSQITSSKSVNGSSLAGTGEGLVGSAPPLLSANSSLESDTGSTGSTDSPSPVYTTPPTSLGSIMSNGKPSNDAKSAEKTIPSALVITPKEATIPKQNIGPSLLAQTAPIVVRGHTPTKSEATVHYPESPLLADALPPTPPQSDVLFSSPPHLDVFSPSPIQIKIADLGNATPSRAHFTEDIQTRQYRAPEAIFGRSDWDHTADVWSTACVVFELLTAEYLFDPQAQGALFSKDDDHMAQIIELLGDFPLDVKMGGRYSREIFDSTGALRYIKTLKPWPLKRVMVEKYLFTKKDAENLCGFLEPMLRADFRARARASDMVDHPWLDLQDEAEDDVCL
ncbi:hypothetical protein EW145_g157 [Phellinidium pouzarii]|uniref:non-specific serine/threonine protein kinase n=1 Tax=Phellinidium pouzarii TaxID=167371 RepID=A0A4S4LK04_9AGAM|nr:hypothetical protein EW145_g157 [Phellinidium pouzarii]